MVLLFFFVRAVYGGLAFSQVFKRVLSPGFSMVLRGGGLSMAFSTVPTALLRVSSKSRETLLCC